MPPKVKIVLLTFLLMSGVIGALAAIQLHNLVTASLQSSQRLADLAAQQTKELLLLRLEDYWKAAPEPPRDDAGRRRLWTAGVAADPRLGGLLESSVAQAPSLVEISIAGEDQRALVSSNPSRRGAALRGCRPLRAVLEASPWERVGQLFAPSTDYEVRMPIGVLGDPRPIFWIQVLASTVLLRDTLRPGLHTLAVASGVSLLASLLFAWALAGLVSRNLHRIAEAIDRIRRGEPAADAVEGSGRSDFALVESKLNLLGAQVRDTARSAADFRTQVGGILERLEEGILLFDSGGRLALAGGAAERLLGAGPVRLEEPLEALVREAFESGKGLPEQLVELRRGASPAPLLVSIHCLGQAPGARPSSVLVRLRDAESRRDLETRMSLLSRLGAINRLTSGVAHEIKNPLNSIAARLALLESMVEGSPEAEQEIRVIGEEIERLDRVVRTFLDFTRPVEFQQAEVDLAGLTREVGTLVAADAARRSVRVNLNVPEAAVTVWGDAGLLRQAILNLAVNAIEATPEGGAVSLDLTAEPGECRLLVADTGAGIPPSLRDKIFQLYFTTKKGGSGIGLAMVYRAVQIHGGRIELFSEPGEGARFWIYLPLTAPPERA